MTFLYISAIIYLFVKVADNPEEGRTLSENTEGNKAGTVAKSFDPNEFSSGAAKMGAVFGFYLCLMLAGIGFCVSTWNKPELNITLLLLSGLTTILSSMMACSMVFGFIGWLFGYYLAEGYDEDTDDQEVVEET